MGSGAKSADSEAALLPKEVGARLRLLRLEAGLTQVDVALRMCRPGPSGKFYVCQIERGHMPGLTLNAVMGFLRACGAGLNAIEDIFDAYTNRPLILEERTRKQVADAGVGLHLLKQARGCDANVLARIRTEVFNVGGPARRGRWNASRQRTGFGCAFPRGDRRDERC